MVSGLAARSANYWRRPDHQIDKALSVWRSGIMGALHERVLCFALTTYWPKHARPFSEEWWLARSRCCLRCFSGAPFVSEYVECGSHVTCNSHLAQVVDLSG